MEILSIIQKTIKIRRYNESKSFFEFLNNNIIIQVKMMKLKLFSKNIRCLRLNPEKHNETNIYALFDFDTAT